VKIHASSLLAFRDDTCVEDIIQYLFVDFPRKAYFYFHFEFSGHLNFVSLGNLFLNFFTKMSLGISKKFKNCFTNKKSVQLLKIFIQFFVYFYSSSKSIRLCKKTRGGLGPKSLRCNRSYKSHKDVAKKASHRFENASIPLMYLKSLNFSKKSSKIIEIFIKAPYF
jgi:hypothetical protein